MCTEIANNNSADFRGGKLFRSVCTVTHRYYYTYFETSRLQNYVINTKMPGFTFFAFLISLLVILFGHGINFGHARLIRMQDSYATCYYRALARCVEEKTKSRTPVEQVIEIF